MKKFLCLLLMLFIMGSCAKQTIQEVEEPEPPPSPPELNVNWSLYPDPRIVRVNPGMEIIFKLELRATSSELSNITIHFGDGTEKERKIYCIDDYGCKTIYEKHRYNEDFVYRPYVSYEYGTSPKNPRSNDMKIVIAPPFQSEEQLKEKAYNRMVDQLTKGIIDVLVERRTQNPKFALTILRDANFEYKDEKDNEMVKDVTRSLVNRGYKILEKHPQVLTRLAHESVVREEKNGKLAKQYMDSLEYGLLTTYQGPEKPFYYAIKMEGVDDRSHVVKRKGESDAMVESGGSMERKKSTRRNASKGKDERTKFEASEEYVSFSNRPLLFAKFSTADYLIVLDRIDDLYLTKSKPLFFNIKHESEMIERTARIKVHVRILSRDGTIVWIKDLVGSERDRVIPEYAE